MVAQSTLIFQVCYMSPEGKYVEKLHTIESTDSRDEFYRLLHWATRNGVELRIRPLVPAGTQTSNVDNRVNS